MTILEEVKTILKIPLNDTSNDVYLELMIEVNKDIIKNYTNNTFLVNNVEVLPKGIIYCIAQMVALDENAPKGIRIERVNRAENEYFEGIPASLTIYLQPYCYISSPK